MEGGISVQTSGGVFVVVMHEDFPAGKADRIVVWPQVEEPSTVEAVVLPESDWLERMPVIPLRTTDLRGGLVREVREMADRTEYHLSMPIHSATYDVARQQLVAKVDSGTVVTIDPATVVPRLMASLPKEVVAHGLRSVGGRPLVSVGYGQREVVYPLAAVRADFREMAPFRRLGWNCCERATLFYRLNGRSGGMEAQDFRTGTSYGTFSVAEHLNRFGQIRFTPTQAYFNVDFIETEESEVWMYFTHGPELFRARLPQPGSGEAWKFEQVRSLPKPAFRMQVFGKFVATREGRPDMIRVYESQPGGEALYEHTCLTWPEMSGCANRLFFWGRPYDLVMLDAETGEAKDILVGRKSAQPLAAFPGGLVVCDPSNPVIIKFKE